MFNWRKNKKGFTLIEVIVVIVIMAILAAAAIPTMLGFISEAKGSQYIAEARVVYLAAQTTTTKNFYNATTAGTITEKATDKSSESVKSIVNGSITPGATYTVNYTGPKVDTVTYTVTNGGKKYQVTITPSGNADLVIT